MGTGASADARRRKVLDYARAERQHFIEHAIATAPPLLVRQSTFVDAHFAHTLPSTLHPPGPGTSIEWLRPVEIDPDACLFGPGGPHSNDVWQGELGDCYLLTGLTSLASQAPGRVRALFEDYSSAGATPQSYTRLAANGRYCIRFFRDGAWHSTIIDDLLPCLVVQKSGARRPLFAKGAPDGGHAGGRPSAFWAPLVEKAYAKTFGEGAYAGIVPGKIGDAMVDLTGGCVLHEHPQRDKKPKAPFFERAAHALADGALLATSASTPEAQKSARQHGLMSGHAYAIVRVCTLRDGETSHSLLRLRNPWGSFEWSGAWADTDARWTAERRAAVDFAMEGGCFWMALDDYWRFFDALHVCQPPDADRGSYPADGKSPIAVTPWVTQVVNGEWDAAHSGGALSGENPVFALRAAPGALEGEAAAVPLTLYATLSVSTRTPYSTQQTLYNPMGFVLGTLSATPLDPTLRRGPTYDLNTRQVQAPLKPERDVALVTTLDFGPVNAPIFLVPFMREPNVRAAFRLTLRSDRPLSVTPVTSADGAPLLEAWASAGPARDTASSAWHGTTAGGPMTSTNVERWAENPQFALEVQRSAPMRLLLGVAVTDAQQPTVPYVAGGGKKEKKDTAAGKRSPSAKSDGGTGPDLMVGADLIKGGKGAKLAATRIELAEAPWDDLISGYTPFAAGGIVWSEYRIDKKGLYVAVPFTDRPGAEGEFVLHAIAWPLKSVVGGESDAGTVRLRRLEGTPPAPPPSTKKSSKNKAK